MAERSGPPLRPPRSKPRRGYWWTSLSDAQLLERFRAGREEAAFAALMQRHGGLVWSICRNVLGHAQDAEDAFQATFLILAHNATSVRKGEAVASWLGRGK